MTTDTYPEVLFANSVLSGNYGYSLVSYSGFSWVENVKGRAPLSDTLNFTPGNALSLKYTSSLRGQWEFSVFYPGGKTYRPDFSEQVLSFRIYLMEGLQQDALPNILLLQGDSCSAPVEMRPYLKGIPDSVIYGQWLHVQVPLRDFFADREAEGDVVTGIQFLQGRPTGVDTVNHLLIDQIEFAPKHPQVTELASPAVLHQIRAGEQHVDLGWQLPLDPGIRYAKIYRSVDGQHFEAVAIRPVTASRYVDFVPEKNRRYYYKVTWVDYRFQESPFSEVATIDVLPMTDEELLETIQYAHLNYFDRHAEFNSGMHRVDLEGTDATVDVGGTGYSLLVQTIGVAHGWMTPRLFARRLATVVDFLTDHAEQYHGAFPAYLDGRTGRGVYEQDSLAFVDLTATASLMQGLLVAKQYLDSLDDHSLQSAESDRPGRHQRLQTLGSRIDQLWERVEWNAFALQDTTVLVNYWSPQAGFQYAVPLGGFGKDLITYLLALASPRYALPSAAYTHGLGYRREFRDHQGPLRGSETAESVPWKLEPLGSSIFRSLSDRRKWGASEISSRANAEVPNLAYDCVPYRVDTLLYGFYLEVGDIDRSLLDAYQSFLAFDPWGKQDTFTNYGEMLMRLTQAYKRRDNELDLGSSSPDIWGTARDDRFREQLPTMVPAISVSSVAFLPEAGMRSIRRLYEDYGQQLFTAFGFRDWINIAEHKVAQRFDPRQQATIPVMIENHRTGLVWKLFMQHPDIDRTSTRFFSEASGR